MTISKHPRRQPNGYTLIEVLVVIAIIAILVGLMLPAIMAARESANALKCKSNLRQIGLGLHGYHDAYQVFPGSSTTLPWTVAAAPYIEQDSLRRAYDARFDPYESPGNAALGKQRVKLFLCPSDRETRLSPSDWVAGNYAHNLEMMGASISNCTDGTSCTGLAVEITSKQEIGWITGPSLIFGPQDSIHRKCLHVLFVDGSLHSIRLGVIDEVMPPIGTPSGGEVVQFDE